MNRGGINLNIEFKRQAQSNQCKKHKNVSMQKYSFLKVKLRQSLKKNQTKINMISVIKSNIMYLQTVLIKQPGLA